MTEQEIMKDFNGDKYIKSYCKKGRCDACDGTDFNGEPIGYGCTESDARVNTMYKSILARRKKKLGL